MLRPWLVLVVLVSASAQAQVKSPRSRALLAQARAANASLEIEEALRKGRRALAAGDADPALVLQVYLFLAETSAGAGRAEEAVEAYRRALMLQPSLELGPDSSPRFHGPFRQAKKTLGAVRLSAAPRSTRVAKGQVETRVKVTGDGAQLVHEGRLYAAGSQGFTRVDLARADELSARWTCADSPCGYYVALTDANGNELLWVGSPAALLYAPAASELAAGRPFYRSPLLYLGAAAGLAITSGFFLWRASVDSREYREILDARREYSYAEAQRANTARQADVVLAASTGILALGAGVAVAFTW